MSIDLVHLPIYLSRIVSSHFAQVISGEYQDYDGSSDHVVFSSRIISRRLITWSYTASFDWLSLAFPLAVLFQLLKQVFG